MDYYMDIFRAYINCELSEQSAQSKIAEILPELLYKGKKQDYAKATLCYTYFIRYRQYKSGKIEAMDLLLFIRDFILFVGRSRFPHLITDVVLKKGTALGVFVAPDGAVDVVDKIPDSLVDNKSFINDVYRLGEGIDEKKIDSSGDAYVINHTKFNSYRSLEQKLAVHYALDLPNDYTLMVSLPTGGGKSLITQILAASEPKLTIVLVPTVSLAKDQLLQATECISDSCIKKKIFCYQGNADNIDMLRSINDMTARLIFTSPEAILKSETFGKALREAAESGYMHNVVIDEAHIVPDWGVHFRPDFQIFSIVLREWKCLSNRFIRTYLLSATLSDDVVESLFNLFGNDGRNISFRCDALRKEPRYMICKSHDYEQRENFVVEFVKYLPKPLIVYVIEPSVARHYVKKLKNEGFSNIFTYTGDTNDRERERLLECWKANEFDVMVATSAFGMGVDKSNIRTIVHAGVPENLSRFYQEVGRGGRDGLPSLSVLAHYVSRDERRNDLSVAFSLVKSNILQAKTIMVRFKSLIGDNRNMIQGDTVIADLNTVPLSFSDEEAMVAGMRNMCWNANALLLLHRQGYIKITHAEYNKEKKTYLFTFTLKDDSLLQDQVPTTLLNDRQNEYEMRREGYIRMETIVNKPRSKCWGQQFVSLFPYAKPICSGCPTHPYGADIHDDWVRIRQSTDIDWPPSEPNQLLRRNMGVLTNMLIPVKTYEEVDPQKVARIADKLGLAVFIYPDDVDMTFMTNCMTLKHHEFLEIAPKMPWLFRNGLFILLSKNVAISNQIFESVSAGKMMNYRKVWCCKLDTPIASQNRSINEFLDCRIKDINCF